MIGAVAKGDLSQSMTVEIDGRPLRGEFLRIGKVVNTMVEQLASFASEVTRVAREVGTEGKLGGQAIVPGVAGTWKELTDSVNAMCGNLTDQVRNIADVTTAVARGDLRPQAREDLLIGRKSRRRHPYNTPSRAQSRGRARQTARARAPPAPPAPEQRPPGCLLQ